VDLPGDASKNKLPVYHVDHRKEYVAPKAPGSQ
jgi:hypothetical protein